MQARLADWRELLRDHTPKARGLLKQLIVGRLEMEPDRESGVYRFHGTGTLLPLIAGIVPPFVPQSVASPSIPSWNQVLSFLQQMAQLRETVGSAA